MRGDPDIFTERGINPEVRDARGYARWTTSDPSALREAWDPFVAPEQRSFIGKIAKQQSGYVITRYPPPGLGLPAVCAEIRPDGAVKTGKKIRHDHVRHFRDRPIYLERHLRKAHKGKDVDGQHDHEQSAKYLFAPAPKIKVPWWHEHAEQYAGKPDALKRHLKARHDGKDESGRHRHFRKVKDESVNFAKRLDVNPLAVPLLEDANRVFFGIEGCLKADAILSQGEAVFSVPSVTLWDAPELADFSDRYLVGKTVFIVPDADWNENDAVIAQAMLCRQHLRQRCGLDAWVAAPPIEQNAARDETGKLKENGVDDFLGGGGSVDDLVVIGREMPPSFDEWVRSQRGRSDGLIRDADVLQNLALHASDDDGTLSKAVGTLAKIMRTYEKKVARALASLESRGAIQIEEGSLHTRRGAWKGGYFDWSLEWEEKPLILIPKHLRAVDSSERLVRYLTPSSEPEQFIRRDAESLEALVEDRIAA